MVQLFQRYIPYSSILDFLVQSLLCLFAFVIVVQGAWLAQLDPTIPTLPGVRAGRALTTVSVLMIVFYLTGYFERRHHLNSSMFVPRLVQAVPLSALTLAFLYQFVPAVALSWEVAGSGLILMMLLMIGWHIAAPRIVRHEALVENVLLIGDGKLAEQIAEQIDEVAPWGFRLMGFVPTPEGTTWKPGTARSRMTLQRPRSTDDDPIGAEVLNFPERAELLVRSLGRLQDLDKIIAEHGVQTVVVALADRRGKLPLAALINAKLHGISVYDATDFYERLSGRMMVARMRPSTIIFSDGFRPTRATQAFKRVLDVIAATTLLIATAPLQLMVAAVIALTSRGPALFRQERTGLNGLPFTILKFRTMRQDAEKDGPQWAAENDDRITPVGRFLRKSRLDELPQLWNVLAGQMSFVGPRPERPVFVRDLRAAIPYYDQRHVLRPGLTGWAQVKFPYGASVKETEGKLEYDLYYIKHLSVAFDITIILETVRVLLTGKGAR